MNALEIRGLTVCRGPCPVVDAVTFSAEPGRITALVGPNGAGKSTLLKAILGLIPVTSGTITWNGRDLLTLSAQERARLVAYVPQQSQLSAGMIVARVVAMGRFAHQGPLGRMSAEDRARIDEALSQVDAVHLAGRSYDTLSCGERHRVLLARALATGAPLVLLDEPTASLDIGHALAALHLLRRLADDGRAVVAVLHHLDEVSAWADHAIMLHRGRVLVSGAVSEVLAPEPLATAFGVRPVAGGALGFHLVQPPVPPGGPS